VNGARADLGGSYPCGWASDLVYFESASIEEIISALAEFVRTSTPEQFKAWRSSIPPVQKECGTVASSIPRALKYGIVLEYQLPDSGRRVDAILLIAGAVLVLELKGDGNDSLSYLEQAADYARRLYWFHSMCGEDKVKVHTLVVSYGRRGATMRKDWITLTNVQQLSDTIAIFDEPPPAEPIDVQKFIQPEVCQPAPSLVRAVREYYSRNTLPRIKRIDDITSGAVKRVVDEIHETHSRRRRKLILLSGVPGAGKTFIGMQIAHESFLDDLAEPMATGGKPTAPAVFLSGNRPLVDVLQYEMRQAGGGGRVFVRGVHEFMKRYSGARSGPPPHHVLIFDEAQRAWDEQQVRHSHKDPTATSEPEAFIEFATKVPGWSVVMGLIGDGQQISYGEEGGIALWAKAVAQGGSDWDVVGPEQFASVFQRAGVSYVSAPELHLSKSVRFHFATGLSQWAGGIVEDKCASGELSAIAKSLRDEGYQIRVTRSLDTAKKFLWDKYRDQPEARFGLMASARDKSLSSTVGVAPVNTRIFRAGPWYADPETSPSSCRRLNDAITEFSAQGLELDHTLLVWGTDFIRQNGAWNDSRAMKFQRKKAIRNPLQLRRNAYRVLLTRGREGVIICLPSVLSELDETHELLIACGCEDMDS
jgi:hypothetical protein